MKESLLTRIRNAATREEATKLIIEEGRTYEHASNKTKRRWLRAAKNKP